MSVGAFQIENINQNSSGNLYPPMYFFDEYATIT